MFCQRLIVKKHQSLFICEAILFFHILYFFYTHLAFVIFLLGDSYIVHVCIVSFSLVLLWKDLHTLLKFINFFFFKLICIWYIFISNVSIISFLNFYNTCDLLCNCLPGYNFIPNSITKTLNSKR